MKLGKSGKQTNFAQVELQVRAKPAFATDNSFKISIKGRGFHHKFPSALLGLFYISRIIANN